MKPLVSVVVNNFNKAAYLEQCLTSIADQTYDRVEIIFWDDNSTDNSVRVYKEWSLKQPLSKIISRLPRIYKTSSYFERDKTVGILPLGVTRWLALQYCGGDYIAFCDSDDWWKVNKLEKQMKLFNDKVGLVFSDIFHYDQQQQKVITSFKNQYEIKTSNHYRNLLTYRNYIPFSTTVFDKDKLLSVIGSPSHYTSGEDYDWILKIAEKYDIAYCDEALAFYRILSDSLTHDKRKSTRAAWFEIDAAVSAYRRRKVNKHVFLKHLAWLYCKLIWKQFVRERF